MNEPSDSVLLDRWRAGDERAGNRLVRRHFPALYRFFRSRLDDGVADMVQQTFLGCMESRARIPAADFRAYLFGIARNKLLMYMRSRRRHGNVIDEDASASNARGSTVSRMIGQREEQRLVFRALRTLPVDLQVAMVLFYWEGMTNGEIGKVLAIPAGTVKSRLHRARGLLKEQIALLADSVQTATITAGELERWARELRDQISAEA